MAYLDPWITNRSRVRVNPVTGLPEYDDTAAPPQFEALGSAPSRQDARLAPVMPGAAVPEAEPMPGLRPVLPGATPMSTLPAGVAASGPGLDVNALRPRFGHEPPPLALAPRMPGGQLPGAPSLAGLAPVLPSGVGAPPPGDGRDVLGAGRLQPRGEAELMTAPDYRPRSTGGKVLDVLAGALSGFGQGMGWNTPLPDALNPTFRRAEWERHVDREEGRIRQRRADEVGEEDRRRGIAREGLNEELIRAEIAERQARAAAAAQPKQGRRTFQVVNGMAIFDDDPTNAVPIKGLPQRDPSEPPRATIQRQDGSSLIIERQPDGRWAEAQMVGGGSVVSTPPPKGPTTEEKAAARANYVLTYGQTDEGRKVGAEAYARALAEAGFRDPSPEGLAARIRELEAERETLSRVPPPDPGNKDLGPMTGLTPEERAREQQRIEREIEAARAADAKARSASEDAIRQRAPLAFDAQYGASGTASPAPNSLEAVIAQINAAVHNGPGGITRQEADRRIAIARQRAGGSE